MEEFTIRCDLCMTNIWPLLAIFKLCCNDCCTFSLKFVSSVTVLILVAECILLEEYSLLSYKTTQFRDILMLLPSSRSKAEPSKKPTDTELSFRLVFDSRVLRSWTWRLLVYPKHQALSEFNIAYACQFVHSLYGITKHYLGTVRRVHFTDSLHGKYV
jgi:hypothetical protein